MPPAPAGAEVERETNHDADDVLRRLGQIDILRALPPEEVQALVPWVERLTYPSGAELMRQGEPGDALYFIEAGTARVVKDGGPAMIVGAGSVVGEAALLTGGPRSATVSADSRMDVWRVGKREFDSIVERSPNLRKALTDLVEARSKGTALPLPSPAFWVATALRAAEARYRGLTTWELCMGVGLLIWVLLQVNGSLHFVSEERFGLGLALVELATGLLILQGACEAFIHGVERLGARLRWDGFISGTVGSLLSTLPEFVVIAFLVKVQPLAAFVTAVVTIFNNALAFSVYSFFLPKDRKGAFAMPRSVTIAGGQILIAGAATALIVGVVMVVHQLGEMKTSLGGLDLMAIGVVLIGIYGYYIRTLVQYYGEGKDDEESVPADPARLGHDTRWSAIVSMFALGLAGSYTGGESIGAFAESALGRLGLPTIPTAAALAFFAGISEYIIVYKSHRRGELGIALSNVFGGLTQVMFLLLPFGLIVIGLLGMTSGSPAYVIPISSATMLLMLLLFPLFYVLHQYMEQDKTLTNLDAAGMTGIYLLLLYFLFTSPS
ncbi:MAG TPA: cyclic nucleotide-binding domain-containing protein [Gemmatimonadales bacterium]|nr:cyclic nucleotide-binding domain-containing protein [Gemmatimonadales bacterium]